MPPVGRIFSTSSCGPGNDVDADQFADAAGRGGARVGGGLDRADIAAHHARMTSPAPTNLLAGQHHVGGLDHGVGSFDRADQPFVSIRPRASMSPPIQSERPTVAHCDGSVAALRRSRSRYRIAQRPDACPCLSCRRMPTYILVFAIGGMAVSAADIPDRVLPSRAGIPHRERRYRPHRFARICAAGRAARRFRSRTPIPHVEVLTNGDMLLRSRTRGHPRARRSHICLEAYIFQKGEIATRFIEALTERARAGVEVRIVLDAVGSFNTWPSTFRELIDGRRQGVLVQRRSAGTTCRASTIAPTAS